MNLKEKLEIIEKEKDVNYLYISPRIIQGGARLINSYETLELYESMNDNTKKFIKKEIVDLVSSAQSNDQEVKKHLDFNLIFCGDFTDLPKERGSFADFIMSNKDKIVAVSRYIKETETRPVFVGISQTETIYKYGFVYLNFKKLVEALEENNVKCEIDTKVDRYTPSVYKDDRATRFLISYIPKREIKEEHQLKKVKKEV